MTKIRTKVAAFCATFAVLGAVVPVVSAAGAEPQPFFEGTGHIVGSLPWAGFYLSATDLEFAFSCPGEPFTQGVDGYMFALPSTAPAGAVARADGSNFLDRYDVDMSFYADDCSWLNFSGEAGTYEEATLPEGTRYIVVTNWIGWDTEVTLTVTEGQPEPEPTPTPSPTPTDGEIPYLRGDYSQAPNDPMFDEQWNMNAINAPAAWLEEQATGYGITISVVDSGVDYDHPDFGCLYKMNVKPGSDTGSGDDDPIDADGHGTHVNGIAGACTNNGTGVVGVAPDSILMPVKVFGYPSSGLFGLDPADLDKAMADGIRYATENGAHVINLSIGDIPPFSHLGADAYPETEAAMLEAREAGVVIAAAAGNFDQPTCEFPSRSRNVICVTATGPDDEWSTYSDFAFNIDPNGDDPTELHPVVAAPGGAGYESISCSDGVLSTYWREGDHGSCSDANGYDWLSGTSMASPHVAGLAALLYDRIGGVRSKENADLIVQTILDTAADLGAPGYDPQFGYGRIDALAAVQALEVVPHPGGYPLPPPFELQR